MNALLRFLDGWGFVRRWCPSCGRRYLLTMFTLSRECKCGLYWVDLGAGQAWYKSRASFEAGEQALEVSRYEP